MRKKKIFTCFVDFKRAYDSVWHKGLFYKMNNIGIFGKSVDLINDIYKKTKRAIKINNSTTNFVINTRRGLGKDVPYSFFDIMNNNIESKIFFEGW